MATSEVEQSVVVLRLPTGRELTWLAPDSDMGRWQVGDAVDFRKSRWVVLERIEAPTSLTLTLAPTT